ncbi:MAG TPA: VWA domain-containing protein [Tepidisphaeraceae bacterium]|jgi:hypothetical protein
MANDAVPSPASPSPSGPAFPGPGKQAPAVDPHAGTLLSPGDGGEAIAAPGLPVVERTLLQNPFVQTVLPFVTSLTIHLTIILVGVVFFIGAKYVQTKVIHQEEYIIPAASMINEGAPGGVPFQGLGADPNRKTMQDKLKDGGTPEGWADKKGSKLELRAASGGGEGDSADSTIGTGPGGGFGKGKAGKGAGIGDALGGGDGDGGGPLAMFGTPGGGGLGLKGPVFGASGNAKKIVFVCDASGSMLQKFDALKRELSRTVRQLRPSQSFSLIFFQEQSFKALNQSLIIARPDTKRQADEFLDTIVPRAETNPLPALELAFKQKPELIYLLTDGDFPDNNAVLRLIQQLDKDGKVKINTIAFVNEKDKDTDFMALLQKIAKDTGGIYRMVRENDL